MQATPGLAAAIAAADEAALDRIERLLTIDRVVRDQDPGEQAARAEAAMRKHWPGRK